MKIEYKGKYPVSAKISEHRLVVFDASFDSGKEVRSVTLHKSSGELIGRELDDDVISEVRDSAFGSEMISRGELSITP